MDKLTVILADNQALTRIGISSVLSAYFNGKIRFEDARNKQELSEKLKSLQPEAIILDFQLLNFNDLCELTDIKKLSSGTGLLIITDNQNSEDLYKALDCGITNLIFKSCEEQELIEAFNATLAGKKYFCSEVLDLLLERKSSTRQFQEAGKLTSAEVEIVRLIAQGLTTKEIALQRHLSFHTIITHRKNIFRKLAISNASELLMYAMRTGIIDSTEYYI
jgi:Response regulator containing a CheY-like receiver domain and an HTH DNA-binding domain